VSFQKLAEKDFVMTGFQLNSKTNQITVVVPVVPTHDKYLKNLFDGFLSDAEVIDSIIVARSQLPQSHVEDFQDQIQELADKVGLSTKIRLSANKERVLAGPNRNRGWELVTTQWTAFIDADDYYSPQRLSKMLSVAENKNATLVIHDFWSSVAEYETTPEDEWAFRDVIDSDRIFESTFPHGVRDRGNEGRRPGDTNVNIPNNPPNRSGVHHAHLLVSTNVRESILFSQLKFGEDGQFCRDVLFDLGGVSYVPARLSIYNSQNSAAASKTRMRRYAQKVATRLRN
jgi:glycosyltransferase involved in cell wall biosynthesis